jgi:hypothetical protein
VILGSLAQKSVDECALKTDYRFRNCTVVASASFDECRRENPQTAQLCNQRGL